jgi:hypothetical protein
MPDCPDKLDHYKNHQKEEVKSQTVEGYFRSWG